jgi:predicted flavoprotein YhiN
MVKEKQIIPTDHQVLVSGGGSAGVMVAAQLSEQKK